MEEASDLEFNSPELQRLEKELDDALASGLREFNDELERQEPDVNHHSPDETILSIEEDLKAVENATQSIQQLMANDVEDTGNGVKSLACMFEQHISPKTAKKLNGSQMKKPSDDKTNEDDQSKMGIGANRNLGGNNATVLSESSLSIKQGLAMFGSPVKVKSLSGTAKHHGSERIISGASSSMPAPLSTGGEVMKSSTEQNAIERINSQTTSIVSKTVTLSPVKNQVIRSDLIDALPKRMSLMDDSDTNVALPPAPAPAPSSISTMLPRNEVIAEYDNPFANAFTPIKTKESPAKRWMTNKPLIEHEPNKSDMIGPETTQSIPSSTCYVDDATIKQRREALVQGLKIHLHEKHESKGEPIEQRDEGGRNDSVRAIVDTICFDLCLESQIHTPSPLQHDDSPESTSGLDTIMLQDNCATLSPINERHDEVGSPLTTHRNMSDDSESGHWVLPVVNDYHSKAKNQSQRSKLRVFMLNTLTRIKRLAQRTIILLSPIIWCIYNQIRFTTVSFLANVTYLFVLVANAWQRTAEKIKESIDLWSMMSRLAPDATVSLLQGLASLERGAAVCLISFIVSMATEISSTTPRYNCSISVLLWCFQAKPVESKRQSLALLSLVLLSICIDFDWLSTRYVAQPLENENEGNALAFRIEQEESLLQLFVWWGLLSNIILKIAAVNYSLRASTRGSFVRSRIWQRASVFFTVRMPEGDLNGAVRGKVVAIFWMELVSLLVCFTSFFVIDTKGVSSVLFQDGPKQMLSLQASLLYKGSTGVLVLLSLFHHLRMKDLCMICCPTLDTTSDRGRRRITSTLRRSMKCIVITKMTDFAMGVLLFINLAQAHKDFTWDSPKESTVLFALLMFTQTITCIISPCLGSVIAWWIHSNKKKSRERNRHSAMLENTPASRRERRPRSRGHQVSRESSNSTSSKRSSRRYIRGELNTDSAGKSHHIRTGNEYDLNNNIETSQSLFESRISAASPPALQSSTSSQSTASSQLELNVLCSPKEFQSQWTALLTGTHISTKVEKTMPSLSDCHRHFQHRRFYVIASGVVGHRTKLFLIAQSRVQSTPMSHTPPRETAVRCLCKVAFDLQNKEMNAEVRCNDKSQISFFVSALGLKDLI